MGTKVNARARASSAATAPSVGAGERIDLIEPKLSMPLPRPGLVSQAGTVDRLCRSADIPVVTVLAGAGYGKTTVLGAWAAKDGRRFAWVTIDDHDNDPASLLSYIATAVDRVSPIDPQVFDALGSPGASTSGTAVRRLGSAIASVDSPFVLVLDDVHLLHDHVSLDAIEALIGYLPAGSQVALGARSLSSPSALSLARLRAQGRLVEIGEPDLRLDVDGARTFLKDAGAALNDGEIATLVERTEGWPSGLYLAALAIESAGPRSNAVIEFTGDHRFVADYLRSEILSRLSLKQVRFLTRTSVLDRMSGPLCDAVLLRRGSGGELAALVDSNLFVVADDSAGEWFRYHRLFRDLLRAELDRREPDVTAELNARAALWCSSHGRAEEAVAYACASGDVSRVAALVADASLETFARGRVATVDSWFEWLEEHASVERYPVVAVVGAWLRAMLGRASESDRWADAAERGSVDGPMPDGSASLDSWVALLRAVRCCDGVEQMWMDADRAARTLSLSSPWRPTAFVLVGVAQVLRGDAGGGEDSLADAAEQAERLGANPAASVAYAERATIAIHGGRWTQAAVEADRAIATLRGAHLEEYVTSALAFAVAARVALHAGDAIGAQEYLIRAQRLRPRLTYALSFLSVQVRVQLAHAYVSIGDTAGARTMLREIEELLRRRPDLGTLLDEVEGVRSQIDAARASTVGVSTLTAAELRLLPHLPTHLSFRQIGEHLHVSPHTVKSQAISTYRKLGVTSRDDAIARARELGLLDR